MMPTLRLIDDSRLDTDVIQVTRDEFRRAPRARFGRLVGLDPIAHAHHALDRMQAQLDDLADLAEGEFRFNAEDDGPRAA